MILLDTNIVIEILKGNENIIYTVKQIKSKNLGI